MCESSLGAAAGLRISGGEWRNEPFYHGLALNLVPEREVELCGSHNSPLLRPGDQTIVLLVRTGNLG